MRLGIAVNSVMSERSGYTTTRLGQAAVNRGHEVFVMGVADFAYDADENIRARARTVSKPNYRTPDAYLSDLQGKAGRSERITVDDLDILMLRNDPSEDKGSRTWAQSAGIDFGRIAMRHGVIVLNDPNALAKATNKMYFQLFPEEVRPKTLITLDRDEIKDFIKDLGGHAEVHALELLRGRDPGAGA